MKETLMNDFRKNIRLKKRIQNISYFCFWNPEKKFDFWEAENFAKSLNYAGISNWQIPDLGYIEVLHHLRERHMIKIPEKFKAEQFWSSDKFSTSLAYFSSFSDWYLKRNFALFDMEFSIILANYKIINKRLYFEI